MGDGDHRARARWRALGVTKCAQSLLSIWIASSSVAMAEGENYDVLSMFVDDFAQEIELNPDS